MVKAPKAVVVPRLTHASSEGAHIHSPRCNRVQMHKTAVTPVWDVTERPSAGNASLTPSLLNSNPNLWTWLTRDLWWIPSGLPPATRPSDAISLEFYILISFQWERLKWEFFLRKKKSETSPLENSLVLWEDYLPNSRFWHHSSDNLAKLNK